MRFEEKQKKLFEYIRENMYKVLDSQMELIEGLDTSEFIDFKDSDFSYTIAKQDITQDLIDEYMSKVETCDEFLEDYVFKHVYQISLNKREVN